MITTMKVINMRRTTLFVVTLCFVFGVNRGDFELTILHTNDVHARFEEFSEFASPCTTNKCFGGVARRVSKINEIRLNEQNVILLDAGDQYQGTLWFYVHKGKAAQHFMNIARYDAMALGNHEFDNYVSGVIPFMENVTFPVLSANINASLEPEMEPLLAPSTVLDVGGEKVGVIGYTTKSTPVLSYTGKLIFRDEVTAIREEVQKLKNDGVNKIIALGHAGFKVDNDIAKSIEGVDIVIGGHTNTFLYTGEQPSVEDPAGEYPHVVTKSGGGKALVVQDYAFGKYLGYLRVAFDNNGQVKNWTGNPILLDSSVPKDNATSADVAEWMEPITSAFEDITGRTHVFLDGTRTSCRLKECNLGNLLTDAMVSRHMREPDELYWSEVTMAILNGGAIRGSINQGDISMGDILTVQPFSNTVDLVELQGRYIKQMFEHSVSNWDPIEQDGKFLQISGIRVLYNLYNPEGSRVVDLQVLCTKCRVPEYVPIEDSTSYQFIAPAFIVSGGDGYSMIKEHMTKHHIFGDLDIDVAVEYIGSTSPIITPVEGRIRFVESNRDPCESSSSSQTLPHTLWTVCILLAANFS